MGDWLREIPDWLWVTGIGIATSVALWWRRQAAGLDFFQEATDDERDRLENLQARAIQRLESENARLEEENKVLRDALSCGEEGEAER